MLSVLRTGSPALNVDVFTAAILDRVAIEYLPRRLSVSIPSERGAASIDEALDFRECDLDLVRHEAAHLEEAVNHSRCAGIAGGDLRRLQTLGVRTRFIAQRVVFGGDD